MKEQSLTAHLVDLRSFFIRSAIILCIGFCFCWFYVDELFAFIREPIVGFLPNQALVFISPTEKFISYIKVAFLASVFFSIPFLLYQLWVFVAPALYKKEKKFMAAFLLIGSALFVLGGSFVYFIVFPNAFSFLLNFGSSADQAMISIAEYLSFFFVMFLVFGSAFEMPLVFSVLAVMGIVSSQFLTSSRRYAVVLLAVASAVLTPPDIFSMVFMLAPLLLLYEISIFFVKILEKKA
ncbi:MAG: twin-arginine translocase subunit TatC [Bdellovibrionaceae bacterium]|nr:twin-arginine translocase subunit TatC [Pseudobdellovibrionaceae bacterium]